MQISSTNLTRPAYNPAKPQAKEAPASAPSDSVTFSSLDVKSGLLFGALGFVPVIGAASNFMAGMESGFNDNQVGATAGGVGTLANLAGTASLAGGLLFGSQTATYAGMGLLGVSGLTAAYAGFF